MRTGGAFQALLRFHTMPIRDLNNSDGHSTQHAPVYSSFRPMCRQITFSRCLHLFYLMSIYRNLGAWGVEVTRGSSITGEACSVTNQALGITLVEEVGLHFYGRRLDSQLPFAQKAPDVRLNKDLEFISPPPLSSATRSSIDCLGVGTTYPELAYLGTQTYLLMREYLNP